MIKLRIAFLASHNGSSAQAIISEIDKGTISAEAVLIISNNPNSPALEFGKRHIPPISTLEINKHTHIEDLDRVLCQTLKQYKADLLILSGYMKKIGSYTLEKYRGRILNVHPALPTSPYKGEGFYGDKIHQAVLDHGDTQTGAMIHVVDEVYDHGVVISSTTIPVVSTDTVESLRKRVQNVEKQLFVQVVRDIAQGKLRLPIQ